MTGTLPPPTQGQQPRYEFPNDNTLVGLINQLHDYTKKNTDDMLPATIVSYDRANNLATVQPSIHMVATDGTLVGRAAVASIPVIALGGGGFYINFPLVAGSRGWIKASDRDISLYMQSGMNAAPNSQRMHSFSDGVFIPDIVNGFTVSPDDANNMVISSVDGTIKVTLGGNELNLTAPTVKVNGIFVVNGTPFLEYKPQGVQSGDEMGTGLAP